MSLLMDALRRAEAEKKQQEARAARAAPAAPSVPPESDAPTRISSFAGSEDVTLQIESRALAERMSATAALELEDDGDADPAASAPKLALEPMQERTFSNVTLAAEDGDAGEGTTLGAYGRSEETSTLPSSRGLENDLNAYFDRSRSMEVPRGAAHRTEFTLEDVPTHTVVDAQTVFTASERPRAGRIVLFGTPLAVVTVLAIGAVGLYYAQQSEAPRRMPSPVVASGVEKPLARELPVVSLDANPAPPAPALARLDTQAPSAVDTSSPSAMAAGAASPTIAGQLADETPPPASGDTDAGSPSLPTSVPAVSVVAPAGNAAPTATPVAPPVASADPPRASIAPSSSGAASPRVGTPAATAFPATLPVAAAAPTFDVSAAGEVRIARSPHPAASDDALARAYAAFGAGDLDQAEALYRAALAGQPDRRDALLGLGAVALKRGDLSSAYRYYAAVLARYPDDAVASAALFSLTGGEGEATAARLRMLLDSHADAGFIHFALGNWYARQRRWGDAQQAYFDAVRLDAANPDYNYNLAISLDRMGQRQAALEYYQKSLTLADDAGGAFNPASVLERIKSLSAAP